jgi:hypothetical protein
MADNNDSSKALYDEAGRIVRLCETLDFEGIVQHRPNAINALQNAVRVLNVSLPRRGGDGLGEYASAQPAPRLSTTTDTPPEVSAEEKALLQQRRREVLESLSQAGLGDRLGKVYSTSAETRLQPFREAPHKNGLPAFDMVMAPDFSPESGLHGIFVAAQEVMSCVLPGADANRLWQVRERARFSTPEELVDFVSLMSAGFPVG